MTTINGDNTANNILGTGADDLIYAGGGDDTVNGQGGNDTIYGDSAPLNFVMSALDEGIPGPATAASQVIDGMTITGWKYVGDPLGTPTLTAGMVLVNQNAGNGDVIAGAPIGIGVGSNPGDGSNWGEGTRGLDNEGNDEMLRIALNPVGSDQYVAYDGSISVNLRDLGTSGASLLVKAFHGSTAVATKAFSGLTGTSATLNFAFPDGFDRLELYVLDAAPEADVDRARVYVTGATFGSATTGSGNDVLNGGAGTDAVYGGGGNDTIQVFQDDAQFDTIQGDAGTDTVEVLGNWVRFNGFDAAGSSIEVFDANGKNVHGNGNANTLDFSGLDTVLDSPLGAGKGLRINAESGADTVTGTNFDDEVNAGDGDDTVNGLDGNDTLNGENGNDTLNGGAGNDLITGGAGNDTVDGGAGNDTIQVSQDDAQFDGIQGGTDTDTVKVLGNWVRFDQFNAGTSSIETLDASGKNVHGNGNANIFDFSAAEMLNVGQVNLENGNDTVSTSTSHNVATAYDGQGGSDRINLVFTVDQLVGFGVTGIGTLNSYVAAPTGQVLAAAGGTHNVPSLQFLARNFESATANVRLDGQVYDITAGLVGIDNVVVATPLQVTINGTPDQDLIVGNAQNNTINGLAEADLVFAGAGNDTIKGGGGADYLFGGEGDDTFQANLTEAEFDVLQGGNGIDTLQRTTDGGQGNLVLNSFLGTNGIERVNLDAGGSNRNVEGNANGNVLDFSATTLLSGSVFGLGGNDTISATNSAARTYDGGEGNDTLNGGTQNDTLIGGAGDDTIAGNGGGDRITGGAGNDALSGGAGNDVFRFNSPGEGVDTISDFNVTDDQFDLSSAGFAGVGGLGTLSAARFAQLGSETANTRIIFDPATGNLFYDTDGVGGTAAVQFAVVPIGVVVTFADFSIGS